jgi:hypothetical protein
MISTKIIIALIIINVSLNAWIHNTPAIVGWASALIGYLRILQLENKKQ